MKPLVTKIAFACVLMLSAMMCGCSHSTEAQDQPQTPDEELPVAEAVGVIAFVNVNLVPMTEADMVPAQTVIVRHGKIAEIGPAREIAVPEEAVIINGAEKYLMPGLADMHTHIYFQEDLLLYVANGVTTVLNMGSPAGILQFRAEIASGQRLGPTIFASAFVDGEGNRGWIVRTPAEARTGVRDIKRMGWDFIKAYNSIPTEAYLALLEEAKQQGLAVIGHGVRAPGMSGILQAGQVMIAHAEEYLYTHFRNGRDPTLISPAIEMTRKAGAYVTPTLSAYEIIMKQWGNPPGLEELLARPEIKYVPPSRVQQWRTSSPYFNRTGSLQPAYEFQKKFIKDFHDAGIPLLLGTDSAGDPGIPGMIPGFGIHDDLRNLVATGLRPSEAIKAGTRNAGEFIGKYVSGVEPFGTIETGKRADLILLTANPLTDVANVAKRAGVMVHGRWLAERKLKQMLEELARSWGN